MDLEEAIKILKNINVLNLEEYTEDEINQAIKVVLKELDKKDKIIAEYNKRGQTLNNLMNAKDTYMYKEICKNFIPKDKVRERLQKEYDLYNSKEQSKYSQDIIDVLEELLEEEE